VNVFVREMKATRKSLIIWSLGLFFMVVGGMSKYEVTASTGQSLNEMISKMPKSLQAFMGAGTLDLSTAVGYYGVVFSYLLLMAAIHSLMLGATLIAKEERDKTAEFLLAKPISRTKIVTAKFLAILFNIFIFNMVTLLFSIMTVQHYSKAGEPLENIYLLLVGMFLLQLLFASLGAGMAAVSTNPKRAVSLGTAILLLMYLLSIVIDLNQTLENLKYMTPFKYFEAKSVIKKGAIDSSYMGISVIMTALFVSISYYSYQKRDIHV
jgi:ABC-2 type transport system permease protein